MLHRSPVIPLLGAAALWLGAACAPTIVEERDLRARPAAPAPPAPPPAAACLAGGEECQTGGEPCCGGLFCADTGYGYGSCQSPAPDGAYCEDGGQCQSGLCSSYTCVAELPACVGLGVYCAGVAPCCEGYCLPSGYAPEAGTCAPLLVEGSECGQGDQCQSGICALGTCRSAECTALGTDCYSDTTCCGGFCTASGYSYAPGACTAPQPAGAYCETPYWCASLSCVDAVCAP